MTPALTLSIAAFATLLPGAAYGLFRRGAPAGLTFWAVVSVGAAGSLAYLASQARAGWPGGFALSLWASIAVTLLAYFSVSLLQPAAKRLAGLVLPYLGLLGFLALAFGGAEQTGGAPVKLGFWLSLHIVLSILTYSLVTIAALSGLSVVLRDKALRRKRQAPWVETFPSISDGEALELRLLWAAEFVLAAGIVTGMALEYLGTGSLLAFDHKTLLSLIAFAVIALLLYLSYRKGLRGRAVARAALATFVVLTLAFPGVKFVTEVLLG